LELRTLKNKKTFWMIQLFINSILMILLRGKETTRLNKKKKLLRENMMQR